MRTVISHDGEVENVSDVDQMVVYDDKNNPIMAVAKTEHSDVYKVGVTGDAGFEKLLRSMGLRVPTNLTQISSL